MFIISLLLLCVIYYLWVKLQQKVDYEEEAVQKLREEKIELLLENTALRKEYEEKLYANEKYLNYEFLQQEQIYREKVSELERLLKEQEKEYDKSVQGFLAECEQKKKVAEKDLEALESLVRARREAIQQEKDIQDNIEFYTLDLSLQDKQDIHNLLAFAKELYNPQILYKLIWSEYIAKKYKDLWVRIGKPEKTCGIYKITNLKNNRSYIGQSVDVQTRLSNHIKAGLGIDTIAHQKIHEAIKKDGLENFTFEILKICDKSELNRFETDFISFYQTDKYGYNATAGGS